MNLDLVHLRFVVVPSSLLASYLRPRHQLTHQLRVIQSSKPSRFAKADKSK